MSYSNNILGAWTFNESIEDSVRTFDFTCSSVPRYDRFSAYSIQDQSVYYRYGLLYNDYVLTAGNTISVSGNPYQVTILFAWYSPAAVGYTRNLITRNLISKRIPIIAKADTTISEDIETPTSGEWIISEVAYSSSQNQIQVALLSDGTNVTHLYESYPYNPGIHSVLVSYLDDISCGTLRIEIDGIGKNFVAPFGNDGLQATSSALRLNDIGFGNTAYKSRHTGSFIADLVVIDDAKYVSDYGVRYSRYGWEYVADSDLTLNMFDHLGVSYQSRSTISTKSIMPDGADIFIGKSNGEIVKGIQPVWDVEHKFDNPDLLPYLVAADKNKVSTQNGLLKIENTSVRIP